MTSVKVAVRVRPINQREIDMESRIIISMEDEKTTIKNVKISGFDGDMIREQLRIKDFTFDKSFWSAIPTDKHFATQEEVFLALGKDVVTAAFEGYNVCVFAYGQTGSGKSYTMMGSEGNPGFIPRFCKELFKRMTDDKTNYKTEVSYLEIYNEKVRDLLKIPSHGGQISHSLRVREHPKEGPYVQDLSKHTVIRYEDIQHMIEKGNTNRTTAATLMNDVSSRSHAIYTMLFTQAGYIDDLPSEKHSKIHLVDLAGSERADATGAIGLRLKESGSINKSLVTLGNVISTLAENCENDGRRRNVFIPYRDSVLTWLLKDSLGGNAKTIMIATLSPADVNYSETLSTLRYANRAKNIINRPTINEDSNVRLIRELREEIARLKSLLGSDQDMIASPKVQEKLHENEARIKVLTEEWAGKWKETANILQEQSNLGLRKEGVGIVLDSTLPHLIGIDDDRLSTGVMLYHLKEGVTTLGIQDERETPDITLGGPDILIDHCMIEYENGVVTIHPSQDALCSVNGNTVTDSTRLQQGAVILLGRTNMFRFNNPAEAAQIKKELSKSNSNLNMSLLSQSRTSLLTRSLTDIYKSSDNLYRSVDNVSFMTLGDIEMTHRENVEKLETKRNDIEQLEQAYHEAEVERQSRLEAMELEILSKQKCLAILAQEIESLRLSIAESPLGEYGPKTLQDSLINLENQQQNKLDATHRMKAKLEQEIEELERHYNEEKEKYEAALREFDNKEVQKQLDIDQLEDNFNSCKQSHNEFKTQEMDRVGTEKQNLEILKSTLNKVNEQFLVENPEYKQKLDSIDEQEQKLKVRNSQIDKDNNAKWKVWLDEINNDNLQLEDAWKDLQENEDNVCEKLASGKINESERRELELLKIELEEARDLLKIEEDKITLKEKEMLDMMEKEMDSWERQKLTDIGIIYQDKAALKTTKSSEILTLESEIKVKTKILQKCESKILESNQELLRTEKQYIENVNNTQDELTVIRNEKERVTRSSARQEEDTNISISEIRINLESIEEEAESQLSRIREERQRLLMIKAETVGIDCTDNDIITLSNGGLELQQEQVKLQTQLEDIESTKQLLDQAKRDIANKQRQFDEERDMELDHIEFEKLKLKDMEKEDRINGMVEQEVKRRVFEEKLERDKQRRQEREKDKHERDQEMQRLKLAHAREIRRLKAKLAQKNTKVNSQSNPFANQVMNCMNQSSGDLSRRRHSSSSGSLSGPPPKPKVTIPCYVLRKGSNSHHEYEVKIVIGEESWSVFRRYSRFRELHFSLLKKHPEVNLLVFPPRKIFHKSEKVVIERRKQLEDYLQHLMELCLRLEDCSLHPSKNKYLSRHIFGEFDSFFKKGIYEVSKHSTT